VHDEVVLAVPKTEINATVSIVKEALERVMELLVPLKVEVGSGKTWLDTHP
jgi:DNA polymerase-1